MRATRSMFVTGMAVAAVAGMAAPAWAAPAAPEKQPVSPQQCTASKGKVQRADDGVGTCVGGTQYDGHIISDVSTTQQPSAAQGSTAPPAGYYPAPAPGYYYAPAPSSQAPSTGPAPTRTAPERSTAPTTSTDAAADSDAASDEDDEDLDEDD